MLYYHGLKIFLTCMKCLGTKRFKMVDLNILFYFRDLKENSI